MYVTIFAPGPKATAVISSEDVPFSELATRFPHRVLGSKDENNLASFSRYKPAATRGKAGIEMMHAVALDLDGCWAGDLDHLLVHLRAAGRAAWVYTAWSHRDVTKQLKRDPSAVPPFDSFRVVVPLTREVTISEWEQIAPQVARDVLPPWWEDRYRATPARGLDPAYTKAAQGWYLPACSYALADQAVNVVMDGAHVDPDEYLRRAAWGLQTPDVKTPHGDSPLEKMHAALAARGIAVTERAPGKFSACCPSHPETNPSFGYSEGDDGTLLVHCFAGCGAQGIMSSVGLTMRDMFPGDPRVNIEVTPDTEHEVIAQACEALSLCPDVYQRAGRLVRVLQQDGRPAVRPMEGGAVREALGSVARFVVTRFDKEGNEIQAPVHTPPWCLDAVTRRGEWPGVRALRGVLRAPTLRPDGTVLQEPGFDPATGYLLLPTVDVSIPDEPTWEHAHYAATALFDLVSDFPFESRACRSVWLAYVLTRVARAAIDGATPLFAFSASTRGSGKSLLAELAGLIVEGERPTPTGWSKDPEEARKLLHTAALEAHEHIVFDDIEFGLVFGSAPLNSAITSCAVGGRVLGTSTAASAPLRATWAVTGNQLTLAPDLGRRTLWTRLLPDCPHPEDRPPEAFRYPDLRAHVAENRGFYLSAALTILRAHRLAGQPGTCHLGSFEEWARTVGRAVSWVTQVNPVESQRRLDEDLNPRERAHQVLLELLIERASSGGKTVSALELTAADAYMPIREALEEALPGRGPGGSLTPSQVGYLLRSMHKRVMSHGGAVWRVWSHTGHKGQQLWFVRPAEARAAE